MTNFKSISNFKYYKYYKSFSTCLFAYLLICLFAIPVHAQTLSLSIWPPLLEVMIQPGKSITQVYKLTNGGKTDLVLTSRLVPFEPADELGNIQLTYKGYSFVRIYKGVSFVDWFSFQNADLNLGDNFALKAGQEQQIVFKIKVPENTQEDDYYLTLLFESLPEFNINQSAAWSKIQIGSNLLLTVSETVKSKLEPILIFDRAADWLTLSSGRLSKRSVK